jgi:hypothetical protein
MVLPSLAPSGPEKITGVKMRVHGRFFQLPVAGRGMTTGVKKRVDWCIPCLPPRRPGEPMGGEAARHRRPRRETRRREKRACVQGDTRIESQGGCCPNEHGLRIRALGGRPPWRIGVMVMAHRLDRPSATPVQDPRRTRVLYLVASR